MKSALWGRSKIRLDRLKSIIFVFALVALLLGAYWPALRGAFIWDDVDLIRNNPLVTTPAGLRLIWFGRDATDFWPVANSFFWLEWQLWSDHVLPYHLANLTLHLANCLLLLFLLRRIAVPFAPVIALLFALHPMNVEAVAWIFQLKTLLSTFFVLVSAHFFVRDRRFPAVAGFALALLSKVSVVTWPIALFVYDFRRERSLKRSLVKTAPFFFLSLFAGFINVGWYEYDSLSPADRINELGPVERVLLLGWTTGFYLWKAILPYPLAFIYPRWEISASSFFDWLPLIALVGVAATVAAKAKWRQSAVTSGILAYWFLLFPALGLFTIYFQRYSFVADHWHYLALPILVAILVVAVGRRVSRNVGLALSVVVVVGFTVSSFLHASVFIGPEQVWTHTIEANPKSFLAYNNLGMLQFESGRVKEAQANFERSLSVKPDYREALLNLGRVKKNDGELAEAEALYKRAIEASPQFVSAYINLGALYGAQRRAAEARAAFDKALELDPEAAVVHFNLAALHQMLGDPQSTARELGLANKVSGLTALRHGEKARAREFLEAAQRHLPDDQEVRAGLADASR